MDRARHIYSVLCVGGPGMGAVVQMQTGKEGMMEAGFPGSDGCRKERHATLPVLLPEWRGISGGGALYGPVI